MVKMVCTACGCVDEPVTAKKGRSGVELVLWLCFIVPGLIYSIWRLSSRYQACPSCGRTTLIAGRRRNEQAALAVEGGRE